MKTITGESLLAKFNLAVSQVAEKIVFNNDSIVFEGNVRICRNQPETSTIYCNIEAWKNTSGNNRYLIVFHEYLGIAGLETNLMQYSQYPISAKILLFTRVSERWELGDERAVPKMCDSISLEGVYRVVTSYRDDQPIIETVNVRGLPYSKDIYYIDQDILKKTDYRLVSLIERFNERDQKRYCALAFFRATKEPDYEFSLILGIDNAGTLSLGGDFETYEVWKWEKVSQ